MVGLELCSSRRTAALHVGTGLTYFVSFIIIQDLYSAMNSEDTEALKDTEALIGNFVLNYS